LGAAHLLAVIDTLRSTIESVTKLDLRLQSNGTLLTPALCEGLVQRAVSVGVSLDGDRLANDRHRRYANGRSSHSRALRGIALLRKPEFRSAYGGILCTVDVDNDPVLVYKALLREDPPRIDFLLPHATWDKPPPGRGYAEWLLRIYDSWQADGEPVSIRLFDSVHSLEQGGRSGTESLGVGNPTVAVVETDGTWELPDSLKTVSGDAPHTGLDLYRHSADDYAHHVDALRHGIHETPTTCTGCPVVATCGGGLYAHRFGRGNGFDNPSVYCADLARLIIGIRYRQRASARLATMELPRTEVQDPTAMAVRSARRLLDDGADPAVPDVVDGLLRREQDVDRELMFSVATVAGRVHGKLAWQLLVDIEAVSPEAVVSTLSYPYVRSRVRDALAAAQPAAVTVCQGVLAAVAMTAAVSAGHPATLEVPVVDGVLCLPGLGVLALPAASTARVSSSARAGEFVVRPDVGEPWISTDPSSAGRWRRVRIVDTGGPGVRFDDVDPVRVCHAHPMAERCASTERAQRLAVLEEAWSSVRSVAPQLATTLDKMITVVTPLASESQTDPLVLEGPGNIPGAMAIPLADPDATATALVEHAARSLIAATHRAFGLADDHRMADGALRAPAALADAYATVALLLLVEGRRRSGTQVDERWVTARQQQLHRHLDEARPDDRWTKLGRQLLDHVSAQTLRENTVR
jgi:uncharacterized protein